MAVQTIKLGRQKFIIIAAKDYRDLKRRADGPKGKPQRRRDDRDRADIQLAARRLADPTERPIPYEQVRKELRLA
jgi:hypothetical protein